MGTNFYWNNGYDDESEGWPVEVVNGEDDIQVHIGKRSSVGRYCWTCGITLTAEDTRDCHGRHKCVQDTCPGCGAEWSDACARRCVDAFVELGFCEAGDVDRSGLGTACSFTWTMMRHKRLLESLRGYEVPVVRNEYGDLFTPAKFLDNALNPVAMEFQCARVFS